MIKGLRVALSVITLAVFAACGGNGSVQNVDDVTEQQESLTELEYQTSLYPDAEDDNDSESDDTTAIYFGRTDFDAIDFASMLIPAGTPHGYIGHWYVRHISTYLPSRVPFTYRELDAALWLEQMLYAKGFSECQVRLQTFSYSDISVWEDYFGWGIPGLDAAKRQGWTDGHEVRGYSQNIIVTIPGRSAQTVIIGAHYDSLRYPGTSDNASGTALLMESAQRMLAEDNYYTLMYVFFGAHEIGLFGGFYFYNSLSPEEREAIVMFIQADVLIEGPDLVFSTGYGFDLNTNELSEKMAAKIGSFSEEHGIQIRQAPVMGSEKWLFLYKGHTTLSFWGIDPYNFTNFLHSERDCYEYISAMFPGMIERAMNVFALLLEGILMQDDII